MYAIFRSNYPTCADFEAAFELMEEVYGAQVVGWDRRSGLVFTTILPIARLNSPEMRMLEVIAYTERIARLCGGLIRPDHFCPN